MRSRYRVVDTESVYFVTSTIVEWLPVFTSAPYFEIVTNSLAYCRQHKGLRFYAYPTPLPVFLDLKKVSAQNDNR